MANKIYLSDLMTNGGAVVHSTFGGTKVSITGSVRIPAGTLLATSDKILLARFPTGTVFDEVIIRYPDLDAGTALVINAGYDRPVTNPALPYNATTNPYITGAIGTADVDFFVQTSDTPNSTTIPRAGGVTNLGASGFTVTSSPVSAGLVDVSITPTTGAATATAAEGTIQFFIEALIVAENQTQGEFSGADSLDYTTNYPI